MAFLISLCHDYIEHMQYKFTEVEDQTNEELLATAGAQYKKWVQSVEEAKISDADKMKPHFDGNELSQLFGVKPGKITKQLQNEQFAWQLTHVTATKEDYKAYVAAHGKEVLSNLGSKPH